MSSGNEISEHIISENYWPTAQHFLSRDWTDQEKAWCARDMAESIIVHTIHFLP